MLKIKKLIAQRFTKPKQRGTGTEQKAKKVKQIRINLKQKGIKGQLVTFTMCFIVCIIILLSLSSVYLSYNSTKQTLVKNLTATSELVSEKISQQVNEYAVIAQAAYLYVDSVDITQVSVTKYLRDACKQYGLLSIDIVNKDGLSIIQYKKYNDDSVFQQATNGTATLSDPIINGQDASFEYIYPVNEQLVVIQFPYAVIGDMVFSKYDGDTIDKVLNGSDSQFKTQISDAYETAGFHLLGFLQNATYRLTTANKDLKDLASFKGMQIRTMENNNHMAFWTAIGAEPTPLAFSELYFALQSGAVDAEENAADTIVGNNFNEVQKYLACTNHILYVNQICINKDAYASLDPAYQAALDQAVSEAMSEMRPQLAQIDTDNKAALEKAGMTIIQYDNSFFDEVLNLQGVKDLYTKIDGDVGGLGTTLQNALAAG